MRNTLYGKVPRERYQAAMNTIPLVDIVNQPAAKKQRSKVLPEGPSAGTMLQFPKVNRDTDLYERVVLMAACD